MSKFGGFFARKAGPRRQAEPNQHQQTPRPARQSTRTRRGIVFRARQPARRRERGAAQSAARRQPPRSTSSTPSRPRSASWSIRSARRCATSEAEKPRRSACRRCSTIRAPPTANCATRSATSRRSWPPRTVNARRCARILPPRRACCIRWKRPRPIFSIDIAAARAQIVDLGSNLAQRTGECLALRKENRRFDERLVAVDRARDRDRIRSRRRASSC